MVLGGAFLLAAFTTAILAFRFVRNMTTTDPTGVLGGLRIIEEAGGEEAGGDANNVAPPQVLEVSRPDKPWDGASRITILMMGLDSTEWRPNDGPPRTDTMILFTIDPKTMTAGMLSIPRDLWVNVPGFGYGRINTAYMNGEGSRYPDGGGPGLAVRTVEEFLGVDIDYYIRVDFQAFVDFVDLIGGVKIEIYETIELKVMYKPLPVVLEPGRYVLPGDHALAYARNRYTSGGDFDRAGRQQEVIFAIRDQLLRDDILKILTENGYEIYQTLSSGIHTNLTLEEILRMGLLAIEIPRENIKQGTISPPEQVTLATTPDGQQVLKPITQNIRILRDEIFTANAAAAPIYVSGEKSDLMRQEAAAVAVYNGTATAGLAGLTQDFLVANGVNVVAVNNAETSTVTKIYLYTDKPYTVQYLMQLMGVSENQFYYVNDPNSEVDIEIILGNDWAIPTQ